MIFRRSYIYQGVPVKEEVVLSNDDEIVSFIYMYFMGSRAPKGKPKDEIVIGKNGVKVKVDWKDVVFSRGYPDTEDEEEVND